MKKILFISAFLLSLVSFSQNKINSIGIKFNSGTISTLGIEYEHNFETNKDSIGTTSLIYISTNYVDYPNSVDNSGFEMGLGTRKYFSKKKNGTGLYSDHYLIYGNSKFDDTFSTPLGTSYKFSGRFSYFSLFNLNIGYKFKFSNFVIEPNIAGLWNWEIKGKGDVDNKNVDNLNFRGGLKLAYQF